MGKAAILLACTTALASACSAATDAGERSLGVFESEAERFELVAVVEGLEIPWGLAFLPDGRMLITEREGRLQLYDPAAGELTEIEGVPEVETGNQGGLLDVIAHPRYADNGWIYFSYSARERGGRTTRVSRARLSGRRLADLEPLFVAEPFHSTQHHYGCRLAFDAAGYLYLTVGDRGKRHAAQDLETHLGKVVRLHDDGRVPRDNPFAGADGARPEVWSYGHRNPQGLTFHPETGALWAHEHGPRGGDEVNVIQRAANYGWPVITYGEEYRGGKIGEGTHKEGMEQPRKHYVPSIAPSGMTFYSGDAFPAWQGSLFLGAMVLTHLNRLTLENGRIVSEERLLEDRSHRVRNVTQGPDGLIYLLVDDGMVLRLQPPGDGRRPGAQNR